MATRTKNRNDAGRQGLYGLVGAACVSVALGTGLVLTAAAPEDRTVSSSGGGRVGQAKVHPEVAGGLSTEDLTGALTAADPTGT